MAAGKTLRVKLRYRSWLPSNKSSQQTRNIKDLVMAYAPDDTCQPVMELPTEPLPTSVEHGNPSSISISAAPMLPTTTTAAMLSQRKRRKSSASLKRSATTPNVQIHSSSEDGMTLAEKRRNKLGYHRTSVACGHCRRRKIRCLLAPEDPQNRCANCIRLKKECSFFPVDQQPPVERRPRTASKVEARASTSTDSSPALVGGQFLNHNDHFNPYPMLAPSAQDFPPTTASMGGGLVSPLTRAPLDNRGFEFPPQARTSWGSPFLDSGPMSAGHSSPGDTPQAYWGRHSGSPMTPGYSPHPSGPTSSHHSVSDGRGSFTSFAPSRSDSAQWSHAPARSMSFGMVDELPVNYQKQYHHPQPLSIDFRRQNSDLHPPSLQTSANSSSTSISDVHMNPMSAPISSPQSHHWGLPTAWSALPSTSTDNAPYDGSWYSDSVPLAKVQEEDMGPHFGGSPAILYAGAEHH